MAAVSLQRTRNGRPVRREVAWLVVGSINKTKESEFMKTRMTHVLGLAALVSASVASAQTPPSLICTADQTLECTTTNGAMGIVEATVLDADGDGLMVVWMINGEAAGTNVLAAGTTTNAYTLSITNQFGHGTNEVVFGVTDDGSNIVSCTSLVIVEDSTPPVIESITATPNFIWPPNHKMRKIALKVVTSDVCGPTTWRVTSIESNEPIDGLGDGHTSPDWAIKAPHKAWVRAERAGRGSGRVYTINIEVADDSSNTTNGTVKVYVPHDRGHGKPYKGKHDNEGYDDDKGNAKGNAKAKGNNGKAKGKNK
jgi:hypothetical protein